MRKIGFKNFRKFEDFPSINLAPITFLVGENNAGKSTVVKAILALSDFLLGKHNFENNTFFMRDMEENDDEFAERMKSKLADIRFYFNSSYLAHIGTFKRALYNKANNKTIVFNTNIGYYDITLNIIGRKKDEELVWGTVSSILLKDNAYQITMFFDLANDIAQITFNPRNVSEGIRFLNQQKSNMLDKYFECIEKPVTISTCISNYWSANRNDLIVSLIEALENAISATIYPIDLSEEDIANLRYIRGRYACTKRIENLDEATISFLKLISEKYFNTNPIGRENNRFRIPFSRVFRYSEFDIEYLYAHAVSQTVIYSAKDTNDYLSRTIHEFASSQRRHDKSQKEFIVEWMKEFGIGTDYNISSVGGEAHIVTITNSDGEKVNLADKGMGSIQLMVLLFRLAITLPSKRDIRNARAHHFHNLMHGKMIIIEEPEQNLHPMLQSKLADLFFKLNTEYGFSFLIETHSEYLIRRSQVIVGEQFSSQENLDSKNPFKVYYFPSDGTPYDMKYRKDGCFVNEFGPGFFDEASNLAFKLF